MAAWAGAASSLPTGTKADRALCSGTDRAHRGQLCLHGHSGTAAPPCPRVSAVTSYPLRDPREPDDPPQFGLPSRWPGRRRQTWLPIASVSLLFAVRRSSQSIGPRTSSFSSIRSTSSRMAPTTAWASSIVRFTVITAPTSLRSSTCGCRKPAPPGQMLCGTPSSRSRERCVAGRSGSGWRHAAPGPVLGRPASPEPAHVPGGCRHTSEVRPA